MPAIFAAEELGCRLIASPRLEHPPKSCGVLTFRTFCGGRGERPNLPLSRTYDFDGGFRCFKFFRF